MDGKALSMADMAHRLFGEGDLVRALEIFSSIASSAPDDPKHLVNLGVTLIRMGELERAEAALSKAVSLDAGFRPALDNLAAIAMLRDPVNGPQIKDVIEARPRMDIAGLLEEIKGDPRHQDFHIAVFSDAMAYAEYVPAYCGERISLEHRMAAAHMLEKNWALHGFCSVCWKPRRFQIRSETSGVIMIKPEYREEMTCEHCGLNGRMRMLSHLLGVLLNGRAESVLVADRSTAFHEKLREKFGTPASFTADLCEAVGSSVLCGEYGGDAFDIAIYCNVFEHAPDLDAALREAYRILRPGGKIIVTSGYHREKTMTGMRAVREGGRVAHLLRPRYRIYPEAPQDELVFSDMGMDFPGSMRNAGFSDPLLLCAYSMHFGYLGGWQQGIFIADKTS